MDGSSACQARKAEEEASIRIKGLQRNGLRPAVLGVVALGRGMSRPRERFRGPAAQCRCMGAEVVGGSGSGEVINFPHEDFCCRRT